MAEEDGGRGQSEGAREREGLGESNSYFMVYLIFADFLRAMVLPFHSLPVLLIASPDCLILCKLLSTCRISSCVSLSRKISVQRVILERVM